MKVDDLSTKHPELNPVIPSIKAVYQVLVDSFRQGGKLLVCGNGGSAADCEHIVGELMKGYQSQRPLSAEQRHQFTVTQGSDNQYLSEHLQGALPAISLTSQISLLTACANDIAADMVFAQQVYGFGRPGDVLLGITTSGTSRNVLLALQAGQALGLTSIALTGRGTPALGSVCDLSICVPYDLTHEIQECHQVIYHAVCADLEREFFPG